MTLAADPVDGPPNEPDGPNEPVGEPAEGIDSAGLASLVIGRSDKWLVQLGRYVVVGGVAFIVDLGVLVALTELGLLGYLAAAAVGFLCGLATNYALSIAWVFDHRRASSAWVEFVIFALVGMVGLGINELVMWGLTDGLGLWYVISKLVSAAVVFAWNFGARKIALF